MVKRKASILLIASAFLMLPVAAAAQSGAVTPTTASKGGAVTAAALIDRYSDLIGSDNAKSLVNGLRSQTEIVLKGSSTPTGPCPPIKPDCNQGGGSTTVKFMPPTKPMGLGNIDVALALMEADLKAKNAASPKPVKPHHVKAALVGDSVTFDGILKLRAAGHGWGEIANSLGFELK